MNTQSCLQSQCKNPYTDTGRGKRTARENKSIQNRYHIIGNTYLGMINRGEVDGKSMS